MSRMQCHACGKTFRSMSAEAQHRHGFPAYCNKKSKQWAQFQKEISKETDHAKSDSHS